ncbi:MAG: hypothetical protein ABWZ25_13975 [Chitinophagaceae bacterium]
MKTKLKWMVALVAVCSVAQLQAQESNVPDPATGIYTRHTGSQGKEVSYRKLGHSRYEIMDTSAFYIYKREVLISGTKGSLCTKTEYSFSVSNTAPIRLLTIEGLKAAFPGNTSFHYLLDSHFSSDKELVQYDAYQKIYKVKYLFNQSTK